VARFAADEDKCQVIVTSRPYAYDDPKWRLPEDQFAVVRLAPFDDPQIEVFNEAWYTQVMGPRRDWSQEQCRLRASWLTRTF
jgi:predicted NACHT family NTPase